MLKVTITKDSEGNIISLESTGHTELSEKGSDIACAAVSALLQAVLFGFLNVLNMKIGYEQDEGYLFITLPMEIEKQLNEKAQVLLKAVTITLEEIRKQYPENMEIIMETLS